MGNVCGFAADGKLVRIGDKVDHTTKPLTGGVIVAMGEEYKGEPAVIVDYPTVKGHLNRLSKLVTAKPTIAAFGYKVGDVVWQMKYGMKLTIDQPEVGEYKGEPCCYTNNGRPTRFSQIEPYTGQDKPAPTPEEIFDPFEDRGAEEDEITFEQLAEAIGVTYADIVPDVLHEVFEVNDKLVAVSIVIKD